MTVKKKIPWKSGARGAHSRGLRQDSWARSLVKRKRAKAVQRQPTAQTETHGSLTRHAKMRRGKSRQGKAGPGSVRAAGSALCSHKHQNGCRIMEEAPCRYRQGMEEGGFSSIIVFLCFYFFKKSKYEAKFYFASLGFEKYMIIAWVIN